MSFTAADSRRLPRKVKLLLFAAASAALFFLLRRMLLHLVVQAGLAVLLSCAAKPLCIRLERRFPPSLAALLSLLAFVAVILLFLLLFVPQLISQIGAAVAFVPQLIAVLQQYINRISQEAWFQSILPSPAFSGGFLQKMSQSLLSVIPGIAQFILRSVSVVMRAFLAPALAFYFLRDREIFCFQLSLCIPLRMRKRALTALCEMRREVAGYFRGQLLVSSSTGALTALALLLLRIPSWLPLGLLMGLCDFIPYVGPWLGAIPIVLFSLPLGFTKMLWCIALIAGVQQIESLILSPHFMSGATGLHPAYVLLLLSGGGFIGGLAGMLLALPLFICLRSVLRAVQSAGHTEKEQP